MKLVLATPLYPPEPGGPATYAQLLVEHWPRHAKKGNDANRQGNETITSGDEIILVKFNDVKHLPKGIRHGVYFLKVLKAARHADVILALDPVSVGLPVFWAARFSRKPFVVKIVGDFAWEQGKQRFGVTATLDEFIMEKRKNMPKGVSFLQKIEAFVARHAVAIIVPSKYLKGVVSSWHGVSTEKIHVIYNSMVLPELPTQQANKQAHIVSVGRLVPWKGMSELIDAMVEVQKELPEATLTIVGDGPQRNALEEKTQILVREGSLIAGSVQCTGALSHAEVLAQVRDATVYVQNSSYEGLSHQLIEALMLGKAIITTNIGGNPELIEHKKNGILIAWLDTPSLAREIKELLNNGEKRARLSATAIESSTRFNVPTMIEKTRTLLLESIPLSQSTARI